MIDDNGNPAFNPYKKVPRVIVPDHVYDNMEDAEQARWITERYPNAIIEIDKIILVPERRHRISQSPVEKKVQQKVDDKLNDRDMAMSEKLDRRRS